MILNPVDIRGGQSACDGNFFNSRNTSQSRYNGASRVVEGGTEYIVRYDV